MAKLTTRNLKYNDSTPSLFDSLEMTYRVRIPRRFRFMSFGSGSSGNCSYIGTDEEGILIDAGVAPDKVVPELKRRGIAMSQVKGICLTHDHADHIRYVYKLLKKYPHMALYCTPKTLGGIFRRHSLSPRLRDYHRAIYIETPFKIGSFELTAFNVLHDGTDNVGFHITLDDRSFTIATDLGSISDRVDYYMRRANYIMIESNYDAQMLREGRYPLYLKARIESPNGHLDNKVTAQFLADIWTPSLTNVFLCHLSHDNNKPEIAVAEICEALNLRGITTGDSTGSVESRDAQVQICALPRFEASRFFILV